MINCIYQLVSPGAFGVKYADDVDINGRVIVRPRFMSICHADQRYYLGTRDTSVLREKLPMALIHECCGEVVYDKSGAFKPGQMVVLIPNVPADKPVRDGEYENYARGARFLSSGYDGFMREFVDLPADRIVSAEGILPQVAAICEFVSVGVHAATRFDLCAGMCRDVIAIWGDGSLSYVLSCILKKMFAGAKIVVVGKNQAKLSYFSFVDETYLVDELPDTFCCDHAFECVGAGGSYYAIDDIVAHINPQGTVILLGVSEDKVAINTRMVLEKGLTLVGCSRSGRADFEMAANFMRDEVFGGRLAAIIHEAGQVENIDEVHRVFAKDAGVMFKTVFEWKL